jgi:hypothetical protein
VAAASGARPVTLARQTGNFDLITKKHRVDVVVKHG